MILYRISVFNDDAAAFGNYVSLLEMACFLRFSTTWLTPAVRHVARGLKKCQDRIFRFPNFIRRHLMGKIAARETDRGEFAQACFFSFLPLASTIGNVAAPSRFRDRSPGGPHSSAGKGTDRAAHH